jgi:FkbH-like protein
VDALLDRARRVARPDQPADPDLLAALGTALSDAGPAALAELGRLLDGVPVDRFSPAGHRPRPLRLALAGTFTAADLPAMLRVHLLAAGIAPRLYVAGFDQLATQLRDPDSALARFRPDVTACLMHEGAFLPQGWDPTGLAELRDVLTERVDLLADAVRGYASRTGGAVALHTVPLPPVESRTLIGYRERAAFGRLWRELNTGLLDLAEQPGIHVLDLEALLVDHPGRLRDERLFGYAGMAWAPGVEARYAAELAAFCRASLGLGKKVLVLDLDNTLWGGVLGDDGPAGIVLGGAFPGGCYTELQRRAQALRRQGVLLALASKNTRSTVDDVLQRHPDMVLRPDDFVARAVNWNRKDVNLRGITEALNLGLDSVVFVDDSPFERDLIRRELPAVSVVPLDNDPSGYVERLLGAGYFDVPAVTSTDHERTALYRARAARKQFSDTADTATDYLRGLGIRVAVRPVDEFTAPRLEQLRRRTNQFNMTGAPEPEPAGGEALALAFEVTDRFGREGIVGGVWLDRYPDRWRIENFVLSCRVFSRGVEHAVLQHVCDRAVAAGAHTLVAGFRDTGRNAPAAGFYPAVGFTAESTEEEVTTYVLPLHPRPTVQPDWIVLNEENASHV